MSTGRDPVAAPLPDRGLADDLERAGIDPATTADRFQRER